MDLSQPAVLLASFLGAVFAVLLGLLCAPVVVYAAGQGLRQVLPRFDFAAWRRARARQWRLSKCGALRYMWASADSYVVRFVIVAVAGWVCGMMVNVPYFIGRDLVGRPATGTSVMFPVVGALLAVRSLVRSIRYARGVDDRVRADPVYAVVNRLDMTRRFNALRQFYMHRSLRTAAHMAVPVAGLIFLAGLQNGTNGRAADGGTALVSQADLNGYALIASVLLATLLSSLVGKGVDRLLIVGSLADCLRQCLRPPDERQQQRDMTTFRASRRQALIKAAELLTVIARRVDRDPYGDPLASVMYDTSTYIKKFLPTRPSYDPELPGEVVNVLEKVMVLAANEQSLQALDDLRSALPVNPGDATQEQRIPLAKRLKTWLTSFIMLSVNVWTFILIIIAIIYFLLGWRDLSELPIPN